MSSMTLNEFIEYLPSMKKKVLTNIKVAMYMEAVSIVDELKKRSPVDDAVFIASWNLRRTQGMNTISSLRINNNTPYGIFLDEGGEPEKVPWYWPNDKNKGPISKSGKLKKVNGKIWAGGRSPSGFVVGGITDVVIYHNPKRQTQMAISVANAIIEAV